MSQNDFTIANQGFPAFRADLNSALQALASNNSGATEPSTMFANMWWYDSANNIMYIRNEDNDAWIKFAELDQTNDKFVLSGTLQLDDGTVSAPALTFNSDTNMGIYRGGTDILKFVTAGTDRLTILANGDTGIGTASPTQKLEVAGRGVFSTANPDVTGLKITATTGTNASAMTFSNTATAYVGLDNSVGGRISGVPYGLAVWNGSAYPVVFGTNGSERARIDSSGNLLVGTTDTAPTADGETGFVARASGYVIAGMNNQQVMLLNRSGTDGDILQFRKSGSAVGSIGNAGARLFINSGNVGLNFAGDGSNQILPSNAGVNRDDAISLGTTNVRFKDLYLSGGVYLGGTGSANYLDDYEEGTFEVTAVPATSGTATVNSSYNTLSYTKIGRLVTITGDIRISSFSSAVGNLILYGLPFTVASLTDGAGRALTATYFYQGSTAAISAETLYVADGLAQLQLFKNTNTMTNNSEIGIAISYVAA